MKSSDVTKAIIIVRNLHKKQKEARRKYRNAISKNDKVVAFVSWKEAVFAVEIAFIEFFHSNKNFDAEGFLESCRR